MKQRSFYEPQQNSNRGCAEHITLAERELAAFFRAVTESFGVEQAELSAEDWLYEFSAIGSLPASPRELRSCYRLCNSVERDEAFIRLASRVEAFVVIHYRLALEKGVAGARYHAVAEQGVPLKDIATAIGRGLNMPVTSISQEQAQEHFGFFGFFVGRDSLVSSAQTREKLGWKPTGPGLLTDLGNMRYFEPTVHAEPLHR